MPPGAAPNSLEINRAVRRILVSHWIDLGRISISTVRTTVYLRGTIQKLHGSDGSINSEFLETIYRKIKAMKGVVTVQVHLNNWSRSSSTGAWDEIFDTASEQRKHASADQRSQDSYEIR